MRCAYATVDLDGQVGVGVGVALEVLNSFVWLYTWPAVSTLNMVAGSGIPFVRKHMISVLASDTRRPNPAHTTMTIPIIFLSLSGDCETIPVLLAYSMPQGDVARAGSLVAASPAPPRPRFPP